MTTDIKTGKNYGLEERTFLFAKEVRAFTKTLKISESCFEDKKQILRSSGSVGANFIEAKEALSKKDFLMRIKICRKEAEETRYWLRLLYEDIDENHQLVLQRLKQEACELTRIFGSIMNKHADKL